jgi:hypothetical protein
MVSARASLSYPKPGWPPDDSEESVVGTDWHQTTITNLRLGINELAHAAAGPDAPVPWQASSQIMVLGFQRWDGTPYTVLPDIFVYRTPFDRFRSSLSLIEDGPPSVIIEVASPSTYESDLDLVAGKGWVYAQGGVPEYVMVDIAGIFLPSPVCAWRLHGTAYQRCALDAEGRWWSEELPLGLGMSGGLVSVFDQAGRCQLREGEVGSALARRDAEIAQRDAEIAQRDAEITKLRHRLRQFEER